MSNEGRDSNICRSLKLYRRERDGDSAHMPLWYAKPGFVSSANQGVGMMRNRLANTWNPLPVDNVADLQPRIEITG